MTRRRRWRGGGVRGGALLDSNREEPSQSERIPPRTFLRKTVCSFAKPPFRASYFFFFIIIIVVEARRWVLAASSSQQHDNREW
jgi:hypothetical protein